MKRVLLAVLFVFLAVLAFVNAPDYLTTGGVGAVVSILIFFSFLAIAFGGGGSR